MMPARRRAMATPRVYSPTSTRSAAPWFRSTISCAMRVWARRSSWASKTRARNTKRPPFPAAVGGFVRFESWARGAPLIRVVLSVGASRDSLHGRKGRVPPVAAMPAVLGPERSGSGVGLGAAGGGLGHLLEAVDHAHLLLADLVEAGRDPVDRPAAVLVHRADLVGLVPHGDVAAVHGVDLPGHVARRGAEQPHDHRRDVLGLTHLQLHRD